MEHNKDPLFRMLVSRHPLCERRWNRVTRGSEEGWYVRFSSAISSIQRILAIPIRRSGGREEANCLSSRLPLVVPSNAREPPSCASSAPSPAQCAPHWHAFIPLATPVEKPRPSGQSQLAAAARVGRLRWDEVGELDGLGARWEDPLAHSAVQRTSPAPIASSSHFVPPPSPLPYFFTRLVPVKPPPTLTLDLLHICKRLYLTTSSQPFLDFADYYLPAPNQHFQFRTFPRHSLIAPLQRPWFRFHRCCLSIAGFNTAQLPGLAK